MRTVIPNSSLSFHHDEIYKMSSLTYEVLVSEINQKNFQFYEIYDMKSK